MRQVYSAFCNLKGIDPSAGRFVFDSVRVDDLDTPGDLGMEDGDVIDYLTEQMGD